jgi:3-hydroxy-9,10-secoandrosta-1,3,5(10)-triene-9,17-dione monooxygenase
VSTVGDRIRELGEALREQAAEADRLGRLPDETARHLQDTGIMQLLQPREFGGVEAPPAEWFDALLEVGRFSGAAAWVCGIVGAQPFEVAQGSRRLQEEIWGAHPHAWVSSMYTANGRAERVQGGYILDGHWEMSTGAVHCDWAVLGGRITPDSEDRASDTDTTRHFYLPRSDYRIDDDTPVLTGLGGTGSLGITVTRAFVPEHRVIDPRGLSSGDPGAQKCRSERALYRMPFSIMFSGTIAAGALAIAQGVVEEFVRHSATRRTRFGNDVTLDPHQLGALSVAAADIEAGIAQFRRDIARVWSCAEVGAVAGIDLKKQVRSHQVRAVHSALTAVDELMRHAGGAAMGRSHPLQRMWRDAHTAAMHGANVAEPAYVSYADRLLRREVPL